MPLIEKCCCFDGSLRTGSRYSAIFTTLTSVVSICVGIWALHGLHQMMRDLEENEQKNFMAPGLLGLCYLMFFMNIGRLFLCLGLWIGVNRGFDGKTYATMWLYLVPGIRVIEVLFGTYILVWMGQHLVNDVVYVMPEFYTIIMLFVLETFILIACVVCVISYYQELNDDIFHKHYRTQYFLMLSRARVKHTYHGGSRMTSLAGSRLTLATSGTRSLPPPTPTEKMQVNLPPKF